MLIQKSTKTTKETRQVMETSKPIPTEPKSGLTTATDQIQPVLWEVGPARAKDLLGSRPQPINWSEVRVLPGMEIHGGGRLLMRA